MRLRRVLTIFGVSGFLVPVIFTLVFAILDFGNVYNLQIALIFIRLRLFLWPTSSGLMALDGSPNGAWSSLEFMGVLALLNIPVYLIAGLLLWLVARLFQRVA